MRQLGQLVEGDALLEVLVYVAAHHTAFAVIVHPHRLAGQGQTPAAQDAQQDYLQHSLADLGIPVLTGARLLQHKAQGHRDRIPVPVKCCQDIALLVGCHFQVLDSQHDVLQRAALVALLAVHDPRIYYHKAASGDGKAVPLELKSAASAHNKEHFRVAMRVHRGVPLAAVLRPGYVQKPGVRLAERIPLVKIYIVADSGHTGTSFA